MVFSLKKKESIFFPIVKKRGASREPTRGWLAPGYNYWLLLVGACRAETRATTRPYSLRTFLARLRISPSVPWRGGQRFSWTPAQRVPQWEQKPAASPRGVVLLQPQLWEDAPQQSKALHGAGAAESLSPLSTLCQEQSSVSSARESRGDEEARSGCRSGSCSVKCHPTCLKPRQGTE